MSVEFFACKGIKVEIENLSIEKAHDFACSLLVAKYVNFLECRSVNDKVESVVFEVEVELGQKVFNDIRQFERLVAHFLNPDNATPEVLTLRKDFPLVPHINLRISEFPRSLCLYDKSYDEIKLDWTPLSFLERIREWLALTAKGELHALDQPLEPILLSYEAEGEIILPDDFDTEDSDTFLAVIPRDIINKRYTFIAQKVPIDKNVEEFQFVAHSVTSLPQKHGIIMKTPKKLNELQQLLLNCGVDLYDSLEEQMDKWIESPNKKIILESKLIIIVSLPKCREENGKIETIERRAFLTADSVRSIGIKLEKWILEPNGIEIGTPLFRNKNKNGKDIQIGMLNPMHQFNEDIARLLNNQSYEIKPKIVLIGAGALGSQVAMNLARSGFSNWTIIDNDILFPHNIARHALTGTFVGYQKSKKVAFLINDIYSKNTANGLTVDLLKDDSNQEEYSDAINNLKDADIILDTTTSIALSRFISHNNDFPEGRRISAFLNPSATALVILAESKDRNIKLDSIEMQYYKHIISTPYLVDHLSINAESYRYASSCSDISSRIGQDSISFFSAICSNAIKNVFLEDQAKVQIWSSSFEDYSYKYDKLEVKPTIRQKMDKWILSFDKGFIEKVYSIRQYKLPNETGGVIIGSYDMQYKTIYVVDVLPSPEDSLEWPTVYIRGHRKLRKKVETIFKSTLGRLFYIGEWHSHPQGCGCSLSKDDRKAFYWQATFMEKSGYPAIMLIVGDNENYAFYVKEI